MYNYCLMPKDKYHRLSSWRLALSIVWYGRALMEPMHQLIFYVQILQLKPTSLVLFYFYHIALTCIWSSGSYFQTNISKNYGFRLFASIRTNGIRRLPLVVLFSIISYSWRYCLDQNFILKYKIYLKLFCNDFLRSWGVWWHCVTPASRFLCLL